MKINVPLDQLKDRVCEKCKGGLFAQSFMLKELPPLYSDSGQYETMMFHVGFTCVRCGTDMKLRPEPSIDDKKNESKLVLVK